MALQVYGAAPRTSMLQKTLSQRIIISKNPTVARVAGCYSQLNLVRKREKGMSVRFRVRASSEATEAEVGRVTEVNMNTFWPIVKAAGDKTVVLDMYTQWCGPCKVIAPKFQQLSQKYDDVVFLKLDCNQENRPLSKELGVKVVPTFKILKDSKIVKEVTGTKIENLVAAIEEVRST